MRSVLFDFKTLSALKEKISEHFNSDYRGYSPIFSYEKQLDKRVFPRGVITNKDDLLYLHTHLNPSELGMASTIASETGAKFNNAVDEAFLERFKKSTETSLSIVTSFALFKSLHDIVIDQILPIRILDPGALNRPSGRGFSSHKFIGGIFLDPCHGGKNDTFEYALNIAHEIGHQSMMLYQWYDKLIEGDPNQLIYSVIRKTERPAILSLHALVANTMMLLFCRSYKHSVNVKKEHSGYCEFRINAVLNDQILGVSQFKDIKFTETGTLLYNELGNAMIG